MTDAMGAVAAATAGAVLRIKAINTTPDKGSDGQVAYPYSVYSAALGRGDTYTLDAVEGIRHGRVVVQTFSRSATSALADAEKIRAALVGKSLDITGYDTTPCRAELDPTVVRDPDTQGVVGVTTTYTFTATKEAR